jgi:flagellar biosynthesis/type III secretory pathway chaperone
LHQVLLKERTALEAHDAEKIQSVVQHKSTVVEQLQRSEIARQKFL